MKKEEKRLYRILFTSSDRVIELYAREVSQGGLFGFVEVEDLVFGEKSAILVDPSEDALRKEFEHTKRIFIPMHSVHRIEEVDRAMTGRPRVLSLAPEQKKDEDRLTLLPPRVP